MELLETDGLYRQGPPKSAVRPESCPIRPAGFIRRAIAYVIDTMIVFSLFLGFIFSGFMGLRFSGGIDSFYYSGTGEIVFLSYLFLYIGYFTFFHAFGGQTPAKMIMRIKVVTKTGQPPSYFRSLIRTFGFFLSHLFFGFGFLLTLIDRKKRALHDLLIGTEVILSD